MIPAIIRNAISTLEPGDKITKKNLEEMWGLATNGKGDFGLWCLRLRQAIMAAKPVVVRQQSGDMVVCKNNEITTYSNDRCEAAIAIMRLAYQRTSLTKENELTQEELENHRSLQRGMMAQIESIDRAREKAGIADNRVWLRMRNKMKQPPIDTEE